MLSIRSLLVVLALGAAVRTVPAGWEHPGECAEVFDLHQFSSAIDPEGFASCADGLGGMFVVAYDADAMPSSIRVSRISSDGTEVWGQAGVVVPRDAGSLGQRAPVSVAPDGSGGVWVGYTELWSGYGLFRLAHFTSGGAFHRTISVDNTGGTTDLDHLSLRLIATAGGDVLAAWTQRTTARLHAARFDTGGTLLWHTDVNLGYTHRETIGSNTWTAWDLATDMLDGLLVTWLRLQVGTPEIGAQRIGPDGAVWWGPDGRLLWSGYSLHLHDPVVVGDVIGGAYVVMSRDGIATAQHLDPWGNVQWAAGGLAVQNSNTPYYALSTGPSVCDDGAFGFIVAHGNEDLYAQRVDYWGNLLWGPGVPVGHRAGQQSEASIAWDGANGAVVVWQDRYWGTTEQPWRVLTGMRLDATGGAVWGPEDLYSAWTAYDPHDPKLVPAGNGAALCAFPNFDLFEDADDVWALGLAPGGSAWVDPAGGASAIGIRAEPNPFRGTTRIVYDLPGDASTGLALDELGGDGSIGVTIYDLLGRRIRNLGTVVSPDASGALEWDGRDDRGRPVAPGVFLARLSAASRESSCRLVRLP